MPGTERVGFVQFTIDLTAMAATPPAHTSSVARLHSLFDSASIPATWIIADNDLAGLQYLAEHASLDELALAAPASIIDLQRDRFRFQAWLSKAILPFTTQAVPVSTFVSLQGQLTENLDVVSQHGLRTISSLVSDKQRSLSTPRPTRFGLYEITSSAQLPGYGRLLGAWDAGYRAKAAMVKAMRRRGSAQIIIRTRELAHSARAWNSLRSIVKIAKLAVEAHSLRCETVQQAVQRATPSRQKPLQSILRAA